MNKTNIIGAIAVVALLLGACAFFKIPSQPSSFGAVSNTNAPAANTVLVNGVLLPNPTVLDYIVSRVFLYTDKALGFGNATGVPTLQQGNRVAITPSQNVVCSFQNPNTTATSTFEFSTTIASTSANASSLILATAASATATTTSYGQIALAANTQLTWGTSGTTTGGSAGVVAPGAFLNLGGINAAGSMLAQLGGACNVIWSSTN